MMLALAVATAVAVAAAATAAAFATTRQLFHQQRNLIVGSLAVLQHFALEEERLASQGVIQVNLDFRFAHFHHATEEAAALLVLHLDNGVLIDVLMVEASVDKEHLTV